MKVKDLIQCLQAYDPEAEVSIQTAEPKPTQIKGFWGRGDDFIIIWGDKIDEYVIEKAQ